MKALDLSHFIIRVARDCNNPITNLGMQKIMYFIHRDLSTLDNPLISDYPFEAWTYGPVIPYLYKHYSFYAARPLELPTDYDEDNLVFNYSREVIVNSLKQYLNRHPWELVYTSHKEYGAWKRAKDLNLKEIPLSFIIEEKEYIKNNAK